MDATPEMEADALTKQRDIYLEALQDVTRERDEARDRLMEALILYDATLFGHTETEMEWNAWFAKARNAVGECDSDAACRVCPDDTPEDCAVCDAEAGGDGS